MKKCRLLMRMFVCVWVCDQLTMKIYIAFSRLWVCSSMFSTCGSPLDAKQIFVFTDDADPVRGDVALRDAAQQRARDLHELDVLVHLFPIERSAAFAAETFWAPLLRAVLSGAAALPSTDLFAVLRPPTELLEQLRTDVRAKQFKKRALSHFTLTLGNTAGKPVEIGLDL